MAPPAQSVGRRGLRLLWQAARTHPRPFVAAVSGSILFGTMSVGGAVVLGWVTDEVITPGFAEGGVPTATIVGGSAAILGVALARSLGVLCRRYFGNVMTRGMHRTWFRRITDTYLSVPLSYFGSHPTGTLMAHADADVERAVTTLMPLPFSLGVIILIVGSVVALATVDPLLMLVGLALFPSLAVLNRIYTRHVEEPATRTQARLGEVSAVAHESFDGALVVKTLGIEEREVARLGRTARALRDARMGVGRMRALFEPGLDALPNLGTIALLAIGAWRVSEGVITTGGLVRAMALFGILTFPMRVVGFLLEELPRAVVASDRINGVLATPARPQPRDGVGVAVPAGPLRVDVEALRFAYGDDQVLDGIDLDLEPGETVAVVGATGTGKSTLCHLLANLHEPDSGCVRLDGVDLRVADPASVRRAVAVAFQETFLFAASVRDNLTHGEDVPEADIAWALRVARAQRFVARLPLGLDEQLGERGVTLSGGQRQRLALARALLRRPGLLMLDDATSAVDALIEQQIIDGLRQELATTTLIVAHRVSTIALADRVLFLDDGRIAAAGSHGELLGTVPAYAALARAYEQEAAA